MVFCLECPTLIQDFPGLSPASKLVETASRIHISGENCPVNRQEIGSIHKKCVMCGLPISFERVRAMPHARTCVTCQRRLEALGHVPSDERPPAPSGEREDARADPVRVEGSRAVVGAWSSDLVHLSGVQREVGNLLRSGKATEARALVRRMPVEAQAALVALDEDPEQVLSLTETDDRGAPAYSPRVVDLLPTEVLAELIARKPDEGEYNTTLIRAMSPLTFKRTVEGTLDPVDDPRLRTRVSWEWLKAAAELEDFDRRAALLRSVDPAILEDALADRLEKLDLHGIVSFGEYSVSRFRLFSNFGSVGARPSAFIEDAETGAVLDALYEAVPELLRYAVRGAWERALGESG